MIDDRLGILLGLQDAAQTYRSRMARANGQIDKMQLIADELYAEKKAVEDQLKKVKLALAVEQAHSAGLKAKMRAYAQVITADLPDEKLLKKTGLRFRDGSDEIFSDRLYDKAFDAVIQERGLKNKFRDEAK